MPVHQVAPGAHADLALVQPRGPGAAGDREIQIGVVEHDQRVLAAQLERDLLQMPAGQFADAAADRGRAGERDHRRHRDR